MFYNFSILISTSAVLSQKSEAQLLRASTVLTLPRDKPVPPVSLSEFTRKKKKAEIWEMLKVFLGTKKYIFVRK